MAHAQGREAFHWSGRHVALASSASAAAAAAALHSCESAADAGAGQFFCCAVQVNCQRNFLLLRMVT